MSTGSSGYVSETLLELKLVDAQDLKKSRHKAKQSPYCVVTPLNEREEPFDNEVIVSKIATREGSYPRWNQKALIKLTASHKPWINVDIWSHRVGSRDSFLGRARVPLSTVINTGRDKQRLRVVKNDGSLQGYLNVELSFVSVTASQALHNFEASLKKSGPDFVKASQEFHNEKGGSDEVVLGNPLAEQAAQHQPVYEVVGAPASSTVPATEYDPPTGRFQKPSPPKFRKPTKEDLEKAKQAQAQAQAQAQSQTSGDVQALSEEYCQPFRTERIVRRDGSSYYYYRPVYHYYYPFFLLFLLVPFFWPLLLFFPFILLLSY